MKFKIEHLIIGAIILLILVAASPFLIGTVARDGESMLGAWTQRTWERPLSKEPPVTPLSKEPPPIIPPIQRSAIVTTCTGETIKIEPDTCSSVKMTVPLKAGEVNIPAFYLEGGLYYLGKNVDKVLFVNEKKDVYGDGDEYFVVTNEDIRESYLMQIVKLDKTDNQITFKDVMTGDKYMVTYVDDNIIGGTSTQTFTIGSVTIDIDVDDEPEELPPAVLRIDMDDDGDYYEKNVPLYTAGGAKIRFHAKSEGDSKDEIIIIEPSCSGCSTKYIKLTVNSEGCTSVIQP